MVNGSVFKAILWAAGSLAQGFVVGIISNMFPLFKHGSFTLCNIWSKVILKLKWLGTCVTAVDTWKQVGYKIHSTGDAVIKLWKWELDEWIVSSNIWFVCIFQDWQTPVFLWSLKRRLYLVYMLTPCHWWRSPRSARSIAKWTPSRLLNSWECPLMRTLLLSGFYTIQQDIWMDLLAPLEPSWWDIWVSTVHMRLDVELLAGFLKYSMKSPRFSEANTRERYSSSRPVIPSLHIWLTAVMSPLWETTFWYTLGWSFKRKLLYCATKVVSVLRQSQGGW